MKFLLFIPLFLFLGCNDSDQRKPYLIDNTPEKRVNKTLMDVHTSNDIKIATIESQKHTFSSYQILCTIRMHTNVKRLCHKKKSSN